MRGAKHGVGHAAHEKRHAGAFPARRRQETRQFWPRLDRRRQQRNHSSQPAGDQPKQAHPLGQPEKPRSLREPYRTQQPPHAVGIGKELEEDNLTEPIEFLLRLLIGLFDGQAERLDQAAVFHARGASRFARPAIETHVEMPPHAVGEPAAAIGHHSHQLDAAARAVVLIAKLGERRATRRTQPAVNASQEQIVIDSRGRVGGIRFERVVKIVGVHAITVSSEAVQDCVRWGGHSRLPHCCEQSGVEDVLGVEALLDRPHYADFRRDRSFLVGLSPRGRGG